MYSLKNLSLVPSKSYSWLSSLALGLMALFLVLAPQLAQSALPPTHLRYTEAKAKLSALSQDATKNKLRANWEKLAQEFLAIYESDRNWVNRPAALFKAAEAYEALAKNSLSNQDAKKALNLYEKVASQHKNSPLADDALYRGAKLAATWLRDEAKAKELLKLLQKNYPQGDMLTDALALEKTLNSKALKTVKATPPSSNLPPVSQDKIVSQYENCKAKMQALSNDKNRSCWRQPWENLETEFLLIHQKSAQKNIAAAALFKGAQCRLNLSKCSQLKNDYKRAVEIFQSLPEKFPQSPLADDAMLATAQILLNNLGDKRQSQKVLTELLKRYPKGDMTASARNELCKMTAEAGKKHVQLHLLSWDSLDKNKVKITLEFSGQAEYTAKLVDGKKGKPKKQLFLDLNDTYIAQSIRQGVSIKGSLLQGIYVEKTPSRQAILRFDLRDAKRFDIHRAQGNLIVTIDAGKNVVPMDERKGNNVASSQDFLGKEDVKTRRGYPSFTKAKARNVNNMAQQLGLSIHTIFIDAGHGGKDPGTYHHNVVERLVTLDVAKTLGRLLENNGFKVIYSRTTDRFISLSQRTLAANMAKADLFISIHVNAHENQEANGFETYYLDLSRSPNAARVAALENSGSDRRLGDLQKVLAEIMLTARVDESARLAIDIQRVTLSRLKRGGTPARNNGVKSAPFHVLIGAQMPAVLVELGYCSNQMEAERLANSDYRELLAKGLAEGIMAYRDRLTKQHTVENSLTPAKSGAM